MNQKNVFSRNNKKTLKNESVIAMSNSDISFCTHYPEENEDSAIEDITNTLNYIGVFDGIK